MGLYWELLLVSSLSYFCSTKQLFKLLSFFVGLDLFSGNEVIAKQSQEIFKLISIFRVPYELEFSYKNYRTFLTPTFQEC